MCWQTEPRQAKPPNTNNMDKDLKILGCLRKWTRDQMWGLKNHPYEMLAGWKSALEPDRGGRRWVYIPGVIDWLDSVVLSWSCTMQRDMLGFPRSTVRS